MPKDLSGHENYPFGQPLLRPMRALSKDKKLLILTASVVFQVCQGSGSFLSACGCSSLALGGIRIGA